MKERIYEKLKYWKGQKDKSLDKYLTTGNKTEREIAIRARARYEILEEVYEIVKETI